MGVVLCVQACCRRRTKKSTPKRGEGGREGGGVDPSLACYHHRPARRAQDTLGLWCGLFSGLSPLSGHACARVPPRLPSFPAALLFTAMDAPRPARAIRARGPSPPLPPRVYTLNDLDLDCLALILSKVEASGVAPYTGDCKARFAAPPLACKALAAAAARPSVACTHMRFGSDRGMSLAAWSSFRAAVERVAPAVRHLILYGLRLESGAPATPAADVLAMLAAVAPYLESLTLSDMPDHRVCGPRRGPKPHARDRPPGGVGSVPSGFSRPARHARRRFPSNRSRLFWPGDPTLTLRAFWR